MNYNSTPYRHIQENNRYDNIKANHTSKKIDLTIFYRNFEINEENRRAIKKTYGDDLQAQMREKELLKLEEKKINKLEDLLEEERIKKEQAFLLIKSQEEERKRREELEKYKKENERIMNSYVVMTKPRSQRKITEENNNKLSNEEWMRLLKEQRKKEAKLFNENIHNNMEKIRNDLINQQNKILKEINLLRDVNLHSNLYKVDIHNSLNDLREEIKRKKYEEDLQKCFLYQSLVESNRKKNVLDKIVGLDEIYLNRSHNIGGNFGELNNNNSDNSNNLKHIRNFYFDNKYSIDANFYLNNLNNKYEEDKFNLNKIINKNEERLNNLNKKIRILEI